MRSATWSIRSSSGESRVATEAEVATDGSAGSGVATTGCAGPGRALLRGSIESAGATVDSDACLLGDGPVLREAALRLSPRTGAEPDGELERV